MTLQEVAAALKQRGTSLGDYHQVSLVGKASPAMQGHISEGFCAGASVDWLRCVLQGGAAGHSPDVNLAGVAYLSQVPQQREKFLADYKSKVKALEAESIRSGRENMSALQERAEKLLDAKLKTAGVTQAQYDQFAADLQKALTAREKALQEEERLKKGKFEAALSKDVVFERFWTHFGKFVDDKLSQRLGPQKYSNLTVVGASKPTSYQPNGVVAFIDAIMNDKRLTAGNGALIGIYPPTEAGGHAIAIRKLNSGEYHLFDPNFGVFEFKPENVRWAFVFLFLKAYPALEPRTRDNKDYQIKGEVKGEYVIFKGLASSPPSVKYQPTAGATASLTSLGTA
jgi:hypothetical protein